MSINACNDNSLLNQKQGPKKEISKIDGKPIMKIDAADLYKTNRFTKYIQTLAAKDGPAIMHALKEKATSLKEDQIASVTVQDLNNYVPENLLGSKNGSAPSANMDKLADVGSQLYVKDSDGEIEKFVMTLHPWVPNPANESSRQVVQRMVGSANNNAGGDTYLALDPDFFYIHDNENGEENYPVTFPAISLTDSTQKIMVTLTRKANGKVEFHFHQAGSASGNARSSINGAGGEQPNLVFAEATPVVEPNFIAITPGGGGGGGGGGSTAPCTSVSGYGGPVGTGGSSSGDTFFDLYKLHLWANGEGNKNAEIQMIVTQNDDYDQCLPQKPMYDFDLRTTASYTGAQGRIYFIESTVNYGADDVMYRTQDVNNDGINYSFLHVPSVQLVFPSAANGYVLYYENTGQSTGGFPLFNLTDEPGPWRLVLNETDKSYDDFSVHKGNDHLVDGIYVDDIHTFDMSSGTWSEVSTGFTPHQFNHGSTDDPIRESGTRRITVNNVQNLSIHISGIGSAVKAKKYYSGRGLYFQYIYGLKSR